MLMHDKVNRISGLSGRTRTETLRYMGLDKDQRLVLIGSRHHFVLEAGTQRAAVSRLNFSQAEPPGAAVSRSGGTHLFGKS